MDWSLDKNKPISPQLCRAFAVEIASGRLEAGGKLPSVREVALSAGVNPNTVQKAFEELERAGLIYAERSVGFFVSGDTSGARKAVENLVDSRIGEFIEDMRRLGLGIDEVKQRVKEWNS